MKVTIFTRNQPRHLSLIKAIAEVADDVFAITETNTVFPGKVEDFFKKSKMMQRYFSNVIEAEQTIFDGIRFLPNTVRNLPLMFGDLNRLGTSDLEDALSSDVYIVFGSSWITGDLCKYLVEHNAINIHMGVSPYYRGSSCNFWALYDNNPEMVGSTIHMLSEGLDSGDILFHAFPKETDDPFMFGMKAVKTAHAALVKKISTGELFELEPIKQSKEKQVRYTKNSDFTDQVAEEYLNNMPSKEQIQCAIEHRDESKYIRPVYF